MSTTILQKIARPSAVLASAALLLAGCALPSGQEDAQEEPTGEAKEAISCSDAACTGLNPYNTNCILDQTVESTTNFTDGNGQRATISLYYSPSCHAIWGYATVRSTHSSYKVCADDINMGSPQCLTWGSLQGSEPSTMQYLRVGDTGYANLQITGPLGSGSSGTFTRTF
jgi:hypothetical protein